MVVYLMRHGTSEWNLLKKWQGATDTQLAPQGVTQARDAGMTLSLAGVAFETAVCSDLRRAHHTCELLLQVRAPTVANAHLAHLAPSHHRAPLPLQACGVRGCKARPDPRLRECSLGEFEGQTKDQIYGERCDAGIYP
jgi:broad specificity phosphatase PhoE